MCVSDGKEPDYMRAWPSAWIFDNLADCCDQVRDYCQLELFSFIRDKYSLIFHIFPSNQNFQWDLKSCLEDSSNQCSSVITPCSSNDVVITKSQNQNGRYYPDWIGGNHCVSDGNEPQYMKDWPSAWIFDTLEDCCLQHYSWTLSKCLGYDTSDPCPSTTSDAVSQSSSLPTAPSPPALDSEWYVDWSIYRCVKSCDGPLPCGGTANYWEETYATSKQCCDTHLSYQEECTP